MIRRYYRSLFFTIRRPQNRSFTNYFKRNKKDEPGIPIEHRLRVDESIRKDLETYQNDQLNDIDRAEVFRSSYFQGWKEGILFKKIGDMPSAKPKYNIFGLIVSGFFGFMLFNIVSSLYDGNKKLKEKGLSMYELIEEYLEHQVATDEEKKDKTDEEDHHENTDDEKSGDSSSSDTDKKEKPIKIKRKTFIVKSTNNFSDIIGLGDEMKDLQNIVKFLSDREEYDKIGATLPKGILMSGPPGVGKTFIAKAIAGEAGVPFLYLDGGDIEGPLVGQGSAKVKAAFKEARSVQPSILFIDEIDSIGGKRVETASSAYARETINALLSEMDGFDKDSQVLVMGSTNMPEILDEALTRSGRFDYKFNLPQPARRQREELLEHYLSKVRTAMDLDIDEIAKTTWNMVPADITNLVNTAGRNAIKNGRHAITQVDLVESNDQLKMGIGMTHKMKQISDDSKWSVSWHEAGHALVNYLANETVARVKNRKEQAALRVHKITIIPRGNSGGHTAWVGQDGDMYGDENYAHLLAIYGGYIGEEVYQKGDITTGPSGDFQQATHNVNHLVYKNFTKAGKFGDYTNNKYYGWTDPKAKEEFDKEKLKITKQAYNEAKKLLLDNMDKFKVLAETLYHYEQITFEEMEHVLKKLDPHAIKEIRPAKKFNFDNNRLVKPIGIKLKDVPEKVKTMDAQKKKESTDS